MTAGAPAAPASAGGHERGARLDHLFALRPLLWIPAIALFEAGRAAGGGAWWPRARSCRRARALPYALGISAVGVITMLRYPIRSGSRDGIEAERPKAERG